MFPLLKNKMTILKGIWIALLFLSLSSGEPVIEKVVNNGTCNLLVFPEEKWV